jgi:predicted DsbA family dithiol-disulfide isomerase
MQIKVTYYLDVISSWCYWAEPAWSELQERYSGRAQFDWRIALCDPAGLPKSRAEVEWYYRRSGTMVGAPFMLNSGWWEEGRAEYIVPNALAEAAKDFGVTGDRVRVALAEAAMRQGLQVGRWEVATPIAAAAGSLDPQALEDRARSAEMEARIRATTAEFHALQVTQRPTFVIDDAIGDRAVLSGIATAAPLIAAIEAMLRDCAGYASWKAHFGDPPRA